MEKCGKGSKKKIENYFSYKFFIYIFAYIKTFIYLCIPVEVNGGLTFHP
nr:MAG TPA: hypothetical protein [Crassvirales sp.]